MTGRSRAGTPFLITKGISLLLIKKLSENPLLSNSIYSSKFIEYVADELRQGEQNTLAEQFYGYSKNQITSLRGEQTTIKNTTKYLNLKIHRQNNTLKIRISIGN